MPAPINKLAYFLDMFVCLSLTVTPLLKSLLKFYLPIDGVSSVGQASV